MCLSSGNGILKFGAATQDKVYWIPCVLLGDEYVTVLFKEQKENKVMHCKRSNRKNSYGLAEAGKWRLNYLIQIITVKYAGNKITYLDPNSSLVINNIG